jgi:hypothetical protein
VSASSVTCKCRRGETIQAGKKVIVVDTPGLFDTGIEIQINKYCFINNNLAIIFNGLHDSIIPLKKLEITNIHVLYLYINFSF